MKTKYIMTALAAAFVASACSEGWVGVESHDKIYIDEYYNSEARIYEALMAAYQPIRYYDYNLADQYNAMPWVDVMADDLYPGGETANDNRHWQLLFNYEAQPTETITATWYLNYKGIFRANSVIRYMAGVEDISNENRERILAEAVVLRAWYYTSLWKLWGNIPYYETNLDAPFQAGQISADEVYAKLTESLEGVLDSSVLPMRVADPALYGRVNWAMAAMLYTEVVMYQNDASRYDKALGYMNSIITSGQYDLDAYETLFEQEGEWGRESIFEINYFSQGGYRDWSGGQENPGGTVYPRQIGPRGLTLVDHPKYSGVSGWSSCTLRPDAAAAFEADDIRKELSVFDPVAEGGTYTPHWQDTGLFMAKHIPRHGGTDGRISGDDLNFNNNFRVYRFAETLLNAAELLARGASGSGNADEYLNRVRTRAGLGAKTANVDNIIAERRVEFMGEGKRYFDLVRSGKASSVLTAANDPAGYRTNSWSESKKYIPIPQSEIDAAQGSLVQNNY